MTPSHNRFPHLPTVDRAARTREQGVRDVAMPAGSVADVTVRPPQPAPPLRYTSSTDLRLRGPIVPMSVTDADMRYNWPSSATASRGDWVRAGMRAIYTAHAWSTAVACIVGIAILAIAVWLAIKYATPSKGGSLPALSSSSSSPRGDVSSSTGSSSSSSRSHSSPSSSTAATASTAATSDGVWFDPAPAIHFSSVLPSAATTTASSAPPARPYTALGVSELATYQQTLARSGDVPWALRIGSGGQIYSITNQWGEEYNGEGPQIGSITGAWMDRVLQPVLTSLSTATEQSSCYFIQSGQYAASDEYSPAFGQTLQSNYDPSKREYRMLVWNPQADSCSDDRDWQNSDSDPTALRSNVLQQVQVRDVGLWDDTTSIVELTYSIINYGPATVDYYNFNWFALAYPPLPNLFTSFSTGSYTLSPSAAQTGADIDPATMDGWAMWSNVTARNATGQVFSSVYGPSAKAASSHTMLSDALNIALVNESFIPFVTRLLVPTYGNGDSGHDIALGQTVSIRTFLVFSSSLGSSAAAAASLATNNFFYGQPSWPVDDQGLPTAPLTQNCSTPLPVTCAFWALSLPINQNGLVPLPLLLLQSRTTDQFIISTSAYYFGAFNTRDLAGPSTKYSTFYRGFLGWGLATLSVSPPFSGMVRLSSLGNSTSFNDVDWLGVDVWVSTTSQLGVYDAAAAQQSIRTSMTFVLNATSCYQSCRAGNATVQSCATAGGQLSVGPQYSYYCNQPHFAFPVETGALLFEMSANSTSLYDSSGMRSNFVNTNAHGSFAVVPDPLDVRGFVLRRTSAAPSDDVDVIEVLTETQRSLALPSNQDLTYSSWVQLTSSGPNPVLLSGCGAYYGIAIMVGSTVTVTDSSDHPYVSSPFSLNLSTWYHVVVSFNSTAQVFVLFVDGVSVARSSPLSLPSSDFNGGLCIGSWQVPSWSFVFHGFMDKVALYTRVLAAGEVAALYHSQLQRGSQSSHLSAADPSRKHRGASAGQEAEVPQAKYE